MATGVQSQTQNISPQSMSVPCEGLDLDMVFDKPYRPRILIIDDDPDTVFLLKEIMRRSGYDVFGAIDCDQALAKIKNYDVDVILLDLMMPNIDGWVTYEYLRQVSDAPVMVISALTSKESVVKGLRMGADDYVTKPFHNDEVIARVENILRRSTNKPTSRRLNFPAVNVSINLEAREVVVRNQLVHLTAKEFAVLELLARNAPRMVRYDDIAQKVWGEDTSDVRKSIKYIIYLLRHKIETDPSRPAIIINSEKLGYRLQTEMEIKQ